MSPLLFRWGLPTPRVSVSMAANPQESSPQEAKASHYYMTHALNR